MRVFGGTCPMCLGDLGAGYLRAGAAACLFCGHTAGEVRGNGVWSVPAANRHASAQSLTLEFDRQATSSNGSRWGKSLGWDTRSIARQAQAR